MAKEFKADDITTYDYYVNGLAKKLTVEEAFDRYWVETDEDHPAIPLNTKKNRDAFINMVISTINNDDDLMNLALLPSLERARIVLACQQLIGGRPEGYDLNYKQLLKDYDKLIAELKKKDLASYNNTNSKGLNDSMEAVLKQLTGYINIMLSRYIKELQERANKNV